MGASAIAAALGAGSPAAGFTGRAHHGEPALPGVPGVRVSRRVVA
jgi:hypothetical protein